MGVTGSVLVPAACTKNGPLGFGWGVLTGISGAGLVREKDQRCRAFHELPDQILLLQISPKRCEEGSVADRSNIFPHRTGHAANKASSPSPSSKALKPPLNVK